MATRCRVYGDDHGVYLRHWVNKVRPNPDTEKDVWLAGYAFGSDGQTQFVEGDTVLKHHRAQSPVCTVKSIDGSIKEEWYITSDKWKDS